jgi:hypothetical protein
MHAEYVNWTVTEALISSASFMMTGALACIIEREASPARP